MNTSDLIAQFLKVITLNNNKQRLPLSAFQSENLEAGQKNVGNLQKR